jgi:ABC-type glycerol-3-phosphate transport system substrate-binding protein
MRMLAAILVMAGVLGACAGTGSNPQTDESEKYWRQYKEKYGHV